MIDVHLRPPDDSDLPSATVRRAVSAAVVAAWLGVGALAVSLRSQEAEESTQARRLDASTLTEAPPARYPGGVDQRALDASGPLQHSGGPGPSLPSPGQHGGPPPGPHGGPPPGPHGGPPPGAPPAPRHRP